MASVLYRTGPDDPPASAPKDDDSQLKVLRSLKDRIDEAMSLVEVQRDIPVTPYHRVNARSESLAVAELPTNSRSRADWYRWSFSSLKKMSGVGDDNGIRGGDDEYGLADSLPHDTTSDVQLHGPLMSMPRGAWFGSMVHDVMEHVDFTSMSLRDDLRRTIDQRHGDCLPGVDVDALAEGLALSIATPLDGLVEGMRLADLPGSERRNEMEFHIAIADGRRSLLRRTIADIAADVEDGTVGAHFRSLADTWGSSTMSGILVGSVDAFLRIDGRYFVVDYKSNALHASGQAPLASDYQTASMAEEMRHHSYFLQALIYTVGAHRYLLERMKGYDPALHLGGAGYLFVRGMVGAETPVHDGTSCGVYAWQPSFESIDRGDRFLIGRGGD